MIGLDTNVFLRLFAEDDAEQTRRARVYVDEITTTDLCFVNAVVLAEFVWTLAKRLKRNKSDIIQLMDEVFDSADLIVDHRGCAERALSAYKNGPADFVDYFLAEINNATGCSTTATFDANALKYSAFSPVP